MLCSGRSSFEWRSLKTQVHIQGRMTDKTENPHPGSEGAGITSRREVVYHTQKAYQKTC
jgi:hypothetical protein